MTWAVKSFPRMPFFLEAAILHLSTLVVFILAKQQRESIRANLKVIYGDLSWAEGYVGTFFVFRNFGWAAIDSIRVRYGQDVVTWELEGREVFEQIRDQGGAAMLFTTHTGNYDLAGCLFAKEFRRTLHTVRIPERSSHIREMREQDLRDDVEKNDGFKVHYNDEDNLLGIELVRLLSDGELLAIQCDRVIGDVVALEVPMPDRDVAFRVPKGPMTLACVSRCPCYPLYVVRERFRHYRVIFEPALEVAGKRPREMDYAEAWVARLRKFLKQYAHDWFIFENAFRAKK